ncbi:MULTISPECIES: prolipoprotein diacylglyceryl transferase [Cyanophyceae]|uniref:prolipoprotein diacylglyceryl transferase n=1 Tax=Cyanophyceae TaxID=3028117 RepID=UPI001689FF64|nr:MULTISPECIES: prolipoprotein diacylglyceryl transferase [Cyanophyceae]MBD1917405.1 prolipoprotein diacylglyceryl transferase [Phormidium sp. FACHB-77]MBD2032350.1 prolipoprotein diacylglyceryl transferase [Phormidium sp. FACHB-322]MBD2052288.1 prolipoprotein diacylglyceryl transferase [Leptolyngbya sp. FACHB-60]
MGLAGIELGLAVNGLAQLASPGPIIFQLGPLAIRWYGLLIAIALALGITLAQRLAQRRGLDPEAVADLSIWLVLGALPAARLYYVAFEWDRYADNPLSAFAIWQGGIAIHGAILGGMLAALLFARLNRLSFWALADVVAPALVLGQAIGRWGNFFNSEAFGGPTNLPWRIYIPPAQRPPGLETVEYYHPTFLYESLWNLGVFALVMWLFFWGLRHPNRLKTGTLFLVYFATYSLGRLWIEGLRLDSLMLGPLRIAQVVSLTGIALGIVGLLWLYVGRRSLPDVAKGS